VHIPLETEIIHTMKSVSKGQLNNNTNKENNM